MHDITQLLHQIEQGDSSETDQLLPLVYNELRKLAAQKVSQEKSGQTLQATALVHEAYLRLVDVKDAQKWNSRGHFFGAAAEAMRRILVEQARRKKAPKSGGQHQHVEITCAIPMLPDPNFDLLDLSEALDQLAARDPRAAEVVKLRYFAGLTREEAARTLGISTTTADDDWAYAKNWLRVLLSK